MNKILENNQVVISGEIASEFYFNHEHLGEKFYLVYVDVPRISGTIDRLPVMVSECLINTEENLKGCKANIYGNYRSYNKHDSDKNRLLLTVFALEIEIVEENLKGRDGNKVFLEGTICKEPVFRTTPSGREITDFLIAVNRGCGKSDYIPCICWARTARCVSGFSVGDRITVEGRIQSRVYTKIHTDGKIEEKVAYEVSTNTVERKNLNETEL